MALGRKTIIVLLVALSVLLSIVLMVVSVNCHHEKKEAKGYAVGPWTPARCPFPFYLDVQLKEEKDKEQVWDGAMELHAEVGGPLGYGPLFLPRENLSVAPDRLVIPVRDANTSEKAPNGLCSVEKPFIPSVDATFVMGALIFHVDAVTQQLKSGDIVLCMDRYRLLRSIKDKFMRVPKHSLSMYAKHELFHLLIGGDHPTWGCGLSCAAPSTRRVTEVEKAIVKRTYDPLCKPIRNLPRNE
jgi:hypothetical protein